jgi:hypothetical protein
MTVLSTIEGQGNRSGTQNQGNRKGLPLPSIGGEQ